jgi:hypothetical protein
MASKRGSNPPMIEVKKFTIAEIDQGIAKIRRRITEASGLEKNVHFDDASRRTAETNIRETIRDVFAPNSPELSDHQYHTIWHGGHGMYDDDNARQKKFWLASLIPKQCWRA